MFGTFTTEHGTLIIRTQDIRRLEDVQQPDETVVCEVAWVDDQGSTDRRIVEGTAAENLERLIAEDQARSAAYAQVQQRAANGLPVPPVLRGKAGR